MTKTKIVVQISPNQLCNLLRSTPNEVKRGLRILALQHGYKNMGQYVSKVLIDHLSANGFEFIELTDEKEQDRET